MVRLTPDDLIKLVNEALELVGEEQPRAVQANIAELRRNGAQSSDAELEKVATEIAATTYPSVARWHMSERGGKSTSSTSPAEDLARNISIPKPYNYVSVSVRGFATSITITMSTWGTDITVDSSDKMRFLTAKAWADSVLRALTPRWAWLFSKWLQFTLLIVGGLVTMFGVTRLAAASNAVPFPLLITSLAVGVSLMVIAQILFAFPKAYVGPRRVPSGAVSLRAIPGYFLAGLIGWIIARIGDVILPS